MKSITLNPADIKPYHRPFITARGNADGTVTLYYSADEIPELASPAELAPLLTLAEFLARFTDGELSAWKKSDADDAAAYLMKLQGAETIDVQSDFVSEMLAALERAAIINKARRAEISTPPETVSVPPDKS